MASKLIHPDNWPGLSFMEVLRNLAEALNERYYAGARQAGFNITLNNKMSYEIYLKEICRSIKQQITHWFNHVDNLASHANTQYLSWNNITWTLSDVIADINKEPAFIDYELNDLGTEFYRAAPALRQYYDIITRMKQAVILIQGTWAEGGNNFYHAWRDKGIYNKISIGSNSTVIKNGSRDFSIRKEGMYTNNIDSLAFNWPDNPDYANGNVTDIDHQNRLDNIFQWYPVVGNGDNFNTAPGVWPSGPAFGRSQHTSFIARAEGDDGFSPGPTVLKYFQAAHYSRHRLNFEYFPSAAGLEEINGLPKKIKYLYHCDHETGPDNLNCPYVDNLTAFYEATLDGNNQAEILFGDHSNPPASIDIPMLSGGGIFQAWNGFYVHDTSQGMFYVEEWDDGTDGALEYYEPAAP